MLLYSLIESSIRTTGNLPLKHSSLALGRNSLPHLIVSIVFIDTCFNELTNLFSLSPSFFSLILQLDFGIFAVKWFTNRHWMRWRDSYQRERGLRKMGNWHPCQIPFQWETPTPHGASTVWRSTSSFNFQHFMVLWLCTTEIDTTLVFKPGCVHEVQGGHSFCFFFSGNFAFISMALTFVDYPGTISNYNPVSHEFDRRSPCSFLTCGWD